MPTADPPARSHDEPMQLITRANHPTACMLDPADMNQHLADGQTIVGTAESHEPIEGGI